MSLRNKLARSIVIFAVLLLAGLALKEPALFESTVQLLEQNQPGLLTAVEVNDGDTITVRIDGQPEKIRLIGVDTPELHHPEKPVQCFAEAAGNFTKRLISSQPLRLEADPENDNRDRYGRLLRYAYLPDGTLVNRTIIEAGYGFAYTAFPFSKMEEFRAAERTAREEKRGLWHECQVIEEGSYKESAPL